ncbi:hypothetical protein HDV00_000959 [Rhizophlyctis rosea]|nr:hypothetical protein HDV00_000959 [Rhizophlyctis rosea]
MPRPSQLFYPTIVLVLLYLLYRAYTPSATHGTPHAATQAPLTVSKTCYNVEGFGDCPYFRRARAIAERLSTLEENTVANVKEWYRWEWDDAKLALQKKIGTSHRTSPFVWLGCDGKVDEFLGGASELDSYLSARNAKKESP